MTRAGYLDGLRGLAVAWMILFHFSYDLTLLGYVDWNFAEGFWWYFPRVIAGTFLYCVGLSLYYAHHSGIRWNAIKKRTIKLGLAALAVSIGTYVAFPQQWVFFGTLHCILLGSLLGVLLVNHRKLSWIIMILIIIFQYVLNYDIKWVSSIVQKPSMDFIPVYPWLWVILAGSLSAPYLSRMELISRMKSPGILDFLGKHSLKIYLIHQPLIFGCLLGVRKLFFQ
jgi:uncharacterized membrane protein